MKLIDKAVEHFSAQLNGEMQSLYVPEWETTVYWRVMNLKQRDRIYRQYKDGSLMGVVEALIVRAKDESGENLFAEGDRFEMMNKIDPVIMSKIVEAMAESDDLLANMDTPPAEAAEGN